MKQSPKSTKNVEGIANEKGLKCQDSNFGEANVNVNKI